MCSLHRSVYFAHDTTPEQYKEEREVLEEMRKLDERDMEEFLVN